MVKCCALGSGGVQFHGRKWYRLVKYTYNVKAALTTVTRFTYRYIE